MSGSASFLLEMRDAQLAALAAQMAELGERADALANAGQAFLNAAMCDAEERFRAAIDAAEPGTRVTLVTHATTLRFRDALAAYQVARRDA